VREPIGFNLYTPDGAFIGYVPNLPPVVPIYNLPVKTDGEVLLRLLDGDLVADKNEYDVIRFAFAAGFATEEELTDAAEERALSARAYVGEYVGQVVEKDINGQYAVESTRLVGQLSAEQALQHLAAYHPDPVVKHVAEWGLWGLTLVGRDAVLTYGGVRDDAPEHPSF
jgi:hypothetical protein